MNSQNETEIIGVFIRSPEHEANLRDARAVLFGAGYSQGFWTQGIYTDNISRMLSDLSI